MYARSVTYQARHRLVKTVHVSRIAVGAAVTSLLFAITGVLYFAPSASTAGVPIYDHVVVAIMENHDYSSVIGAPYISGLAGQGASMTDSHAIGHPSEPNYLELWSGSNQGVTDDSCPHTFTTPSLGTQMQAAGRSIATYSESMPSDGYLGCSSGSYARKHNPTANWVATQDVTNNKTFASFPSFASLPAVSLVVPDLCNDMHDCSVATGDTWLENNMDAYVQWAKANNSLFILTWDENSGTSGNQIATIFVGAGIVPGQYSEFINHYNVLHTIEATQGLPPIGVDATVITDIFGITSPTTTTTTPPQRQPQRPLRQPQRPLRQPQRPLRRPQLPLRRPQLPLRRPQLPLRQPQLPLRQPQRPLRQPQRPLRQPQQPQLRRRLHRRPW